MTESTRAAIGGGTTNGSPSQATSVLIADDQAHIVEALRFLLKPEGYEIETADSPASVIARLASRRYDVLLVDLNYARDTTSGGEGLDLIGRIRAQDATTPIVVMTAWGGVSLAVAAMQRGACDFVIKPWDNDRLLAILRTQTELGRASRRAAQLEAALRQDLLLASQVQSHLFPRALPRLATLDYFGRCVPARVVGGDYFDFVALDRSRLAIVVADVAGKGVSAALMMATLQALFRSRIHESDDPAAMAGHLNALLLESLPDNRYVTFFLAIYDDSRRTLTFVNAGHNPPVLQRAGGSIERLDTGDTVLGMIPDFTYHARTLALMAGDTLLVFSDGVTDAENEAGDDFGETRLLDALAACERRNGAASLHEELTAAHTAFVGGAAQQDDITLVVAQAL